MTNLLSDEPATQSIKPVSMNWSDSLFSSRDWYENFIRTVLTGRDRVFFWKTDSLHDEAASPTMPMYEAERNSIFEPRAIRSLSNFYTSEFGLFSDHSIRCTEEVLSRISDQLTLCCPRWDYIDISPVDANSEWLNNFASHLSARNWTTQIYNCFTNRYLLNKYGRFEDYLKTRGSQLRTNTARKVRKFDRDKKNSFRIVTSVAELDDSLRVFSDLYAKRWQKSEPYPEFVPGLAQLCAKKGWLRLGLAFVGDQPAAAQFWIVRNGIAYMFKVAYDDRFNNMSVGSVAMFKMFEHVMDVDEVRMIDFLTGDETYKTEWMDQSRIMVGLAAFNKRTPKGLAYGIFNTCGQVLKKQMAKLRAY